MAATDGLKVVLMLVFGCATLVQAAPCEAPFNLLYLNASSPQRDVIAADFDRDGNVDLAVIASRSGADSELLLFRGLGDGTFAQPEERTALGRGPGRAVAADFNGDGALDIAVADYNSNNVAVAMNQGNGRFTVGFLHTDTWPYGITASDFTGDGIPDIAVTTLLTGSLNVYRSRGDGSFVTLPVRALSLGVFEMASGDIDGDGKSDLVVGTNNGPFVYVYRGVGDGSFGAAEFAAARSNAASVSLADVDGDGDLDILTANTPDTTMSVLLNNGGVFSERAAYPTFTNKTGDPHHVLPFDGQAAVVNTQADLVALFTSNGDGTFRAGRTITISTPDRPRNVLPDRIAAADFDHDGDFDFAVTSGISNYVTLAIDPCKPPVKRRAVAPH